MSWQEELRQLDEELAAGRISADDYRVRRDQVLSSAVSQDAPAPQAPNAPPVPNAPQAATPPQQPVAEQSSGQGSNDPSADSTQVVAPVNPGAGTAQPSAEATQFVANPNPSQQPGQTPPPQTPADPRQQGHPAPGGWGAGGAGAPPAGFPPQQQAPQQQAPQPQAPQQQTPQPQTQQPHGQQPQAAWNAPESDMSPPWAGTDLPPVAPPASSEWNSHGSDTFEKTTTKKGKGGKVTAIVLAAVVVLAGAGVGGYFLFTGSTDSTQADGDGDKQGSGGAESSTTTSPTPTDPMEALAFKLPEPLGAQDDNSGVLTLDDLDEFDVLSEDEIDILDDASVDEVAWRGSQKKAGDHGPTPDEFSTMVIPTEGSSDAEDLVEDLRDYQDDEDFLKIDEKLPAMTDEVTFQKDVGKKTGVYRGTWVSGDNVIRLSVKQDPLKKEAALSGSYQYAGNAILKEFPVTE